MEEAFAMLYDIRKVICFLFRWGEHAKFVTEIAEYFGWWKMVISVETGLLAAIANWHGTPKSYRHFGLAQWDSQ